MRYAKQSRMEYAAVIAHFGSAYQVAMALELTPAAIYAWKRRIPEKWEPALKRLMKRPWTPKGEIRPQLRTHIPYTPAGATTPDQG